MKNYKKITSLAIASLMVASASISFAAPKDVRNLDKSIFKTAAQMSASPSSQSKVNIRPNNYLIEGKDGKLYDFDDAKKAFAKATDKANYLEVLENDYEEVGNVNEANLKVESVSAINGTQVEVKFNKPVDKVDAEKVNKVTITGVTFPTGGKLSTDGKTLTLTANSAIDVNDAAVIVNPIKSKEDPSKTTPRYVSLMTFKDEVAPTIVSVEAKTSGTVAKSVKVKLSEPAKTGASVKINGAYAAVNFNGTDEATITGLSLETGKTHTIELINLEDMAGNKTVSTSSSFTVSVDSVAPTATLSQKEDNQILVTFNKKMDVNSVKTELANGAVKDEALGAITTGAVTEVTDSKGTQFLIPVSSNPYTNNRDTRTFNVVFTDAIEDSLGNKMEATTQKVTLTKDEAKPVATGYNVIKEADGKVKAIEVTFNKELKASGASDSIQAGQTLHQAATIVNENGVAETTKFANYVSKAVSNGDKKVVFEASTAEKLSGKYAVSFNKDLVKDLSQTGNQSATFSYTMDFGKGGEQSQFEITKAEVTNDGAADNVSTASSNIIEVTFPEAVKGGAVANSATDVANYTLAGKPLPQGTSITLDAAQTTATITLPDDSVAKDDLTAVFTATNIKNTAGNKTVKSYSGTVKVSDNIKPVLESAKVLDNKTIELTYSEAMALTGTNVEDEFIIKNGSTTAISLTSSGDLKASKVSGFDKKVRITIDKGTDTAGTKEVNTLTIANAVEVSNGGNIEVTFNDGGTPVVKNVTLADGDTQAIVAQKIATAFSNLAGYTVTNPSSADTTVVFTANDAADDKTVSVSVVDTDSTNVGTLSSSQTTAGVAPTFATVLDLDKEITVETKDSAVVHDNSVKKNKQKKEVKVTVSK